MIVIPGPIPVTIYPLFWVFAAIIGWLNSGSLVGMLVWVLTIFVSVLIHELGHGLMAVWFQQKAHIQLVPMGGVTFYKGRALRHWEQFLIVLNGPLFGFLLFVGATFLLKTGVAQNSFLWIVLKIFQFANLFWTVLNLLPILPLDGGHLLRILLEAKLGVQGVRVAFFIGGSLSSLIAIYAFFFQQFLIGSLFFFFAFESFSSWRKSRLVVEEDQQQENKQSLAQAELWIEEGKKKEARNLLEALRSKTKRGVLFVLASQYLAQLDQEEGRFHEAYSLLLSIQEHLEGPILLLLHKLAFEEKNYQLVTKISSECYQLAETQETALLNARAFAYLHQPRPSVGWLQAALRLGPLDLKNILHESSFLALQDSPEFREFIDSLN